MISTKHLDIHYWLLIIAIVMSCIFTSFFYKNNMLLLYGDAESHLNISKRITSSITPGLAQLGGIWLPLPHMLMVPFTSFDFLWRTALAGSIVSGIAYALCIVMMYKIVLELTTNKVSAILAAIIFGFNPNIVYLQSTAMTELPLILFFLLSTFYFFKYLKNPSDPLLLVFAAFWGLCASLTRYDGWFLVLTESVVVVLNQIFNVKNFSQLLGKCILFSTLALSGIVMWLVWNAAILKDPFYFTNSPFSAKSQQQGWLSRGELPAYHNSLQSIKYYLFTSSANIGQIIFVIGCISILGFLISKYWPIRIWMAAILLVPFVFYTITLYLGQSVIFIPSLTPQNFTWNLFNTRYGVMMVPSIAILIGVFVSNLELIFHKRTIASAVAITLVISMMLWQSVRYINGQEQIISMQDGMSGLSAAKIPDAQFWLQKNYDDGLVLMDDYSRTLSVIRSGIPMQNMIYIGNQKYWTESLQEPEKYAKWIIMQKGDSVWRALIDNTNLQGRLYANFQKTYTSPDILIFKRIQPVANKN